MQFEDTHGARRPEPGDQDARQTEETPRPAAAFWLALSQAHTESLALQEDRRQRFIDQLSRLDPLDRLGRAAYLQGHGAMGSPRLLTPVDVAHVQEAALCHIRASMRRIDEPGARFDYVRGVLLDLDLMQDHADVVHPVRQKVVHILEYLKDEWARLATSMREAAEVARVELEAAEQTLRAHAETASGPTTNWQHLARAAMILSRHPDLSSKKAFLEAAAVLQEELSLPGDDPGNAIWRGVQRLGKQLLDTEHLPDRYLQFEGFRRLVLDLVRDSA